MLVITYWQLPGKRSQGSSGWQMQAQISIMLWLGLYENRDAYIASLPPGCQPKAHHNVPRTISINSKYLELYQ